MNKWNYKMWYNETQIMMKKRHKFWNNKTFDMIQNVCIRHNKQNIEQWMQKKKKKSTINVWSQWNIQITMLEIGSPLCIIEIITSLHYFSVKFIVYYWGRVCGSRSNFQPSRYLTISWSEYCPVRSDFAQIRGSFQFF